jgi:hypothetical protein
MVVAACHRDDPIRHPYPDSLASARIDPTLLRVTPLTADSEHAEAVRKMTDRANVEIAFGSPSGNASQVVGLIHEAVFGPDSIFFLLDQSYNDLRVYTYSGVRRDSLGGAQSVGGFFGVNGVAFVHPDTLYVADSNAFIHRFHYTHDTWVRSGSLQLPFVAYDVCAAGRRLFVLGLEEENREVLHEIDHDGRIIRSFGVFYYSDNWLVEDRLVAFGRLACSMEEALVIAIAPLLPEVHAYTLDGQVRWLTRLSDLSLPPVFQTARGIGQDASALRANIE